jgi:hypothetical protein
MPDKDLLPFLRLIANGTTRAQLRQNPKFLELPLPKQQEVLDLFIDAEGLHAGLKQRGITTAKKMDYASQIIVLLDDDLEENARNLQRKREIAGDADKSFLYYPFKGNSFEPKPPDDRRAPALSSNARIYIVAHGAPSSDVVSSRKLNDEQIARLIRALLKACEASKVRRVSVTACFGGGNPSGSNGSENHALARVESHNSFGCRLFERIKDIADEVAAYTDVVAVQPFRPKSERPGEKRDVMAAYKVVGNDESHHLANRKVVFSAQSKSGHFVEYGPPK